ncbi:hypothetical protein L218DRAFT_710500 [Marasmius fiardii PR-910]|nr:hypothetical protein L218DRAFT_710500 [Marasmius fiardii PR-910]
MSCTHHKLLLYRRPPFSFFVFHGTGTLLVDLGSPPLWVSSMNSFPSAPWACAFRNVISFRGVRHQFINLGFGGGVPTLRLLRSSYDRCGSSAHGPLPQFVPVSTFILMAAPRLSECRLA